MKRKKIIIIALFLSLFMIGTVNAAIVTNDTQTQSNINQIDEASADTDILLKTEDSDLNTQINEDQQDLTLINDGEDEIKLATDNSDDILAESTTATVSNYKQLYNKVNTIKEQGTSKSYTINLNSNGDYTITNELIWGNAKSTARELTINGNGATIDGKGSKCFLTVYSGYTVTLNNLKIKDNVRNKDGGGSIRVNTGGKLYVNDCTFTNCKSQSTTENVHGGAIHGGFNAKITINNSIFKNNKATYGGGAVVIGASISEGNTNGDPNLDATTITPTLIISNSKFIGNSAGHGGAINIEDYCAARITGCTFTGNKATDAKDGLGGAICTDEISCLVSINNKFENNTAAVNGGGILNAPKSPLTVTKNTFIGNSAKYGGAICNVESYTMTVTDSIFTGNKATYNGGAIQSTDNNKVSISNSTFSKNTAEIGGAISTEKNNKVTLTDCEFKSNSATKFAGAIFLGAKGNLQIKNSKLTSNKAKTYGGAISLETSTNLNVTGTTFNGNTAETGGAINIASTNTKITLDGTTLTKNVASAKGGAIYIPGNNNVILKNCELTGNSATNQNGGAICIGGEKSTLTATNTKFAQNTAKIHGGAIQTAGNNNIILKNSEFTSNKATTNGGALYPGKNAKVTVTQTKFNKNTATGHGGAICGESGTTITLANTEFNGNTAGNRGNAILNPAQCTLIYKGTTSIDPADCANGGEIKIEENVGTKISVDSYDFASELFIEGKLVDEYDAPISNENVIVNIENENANAKTDNNGNYVARFTNITPGKHTITATYINQDSAYTQSTASIVETLVRKETTEILARDITTTYSVNKDLVITLQDSQGNPVANSEITVDLGTGAETYTTDSKGQAKISTKDLTVKTYTAQIKFNGNKKYARSNATAKITVDKETTRITAADMTTTYSTSKELVVTLKNSQNQPVANAQITVNFGTGAKTYPTDSNGQAKIPTKDLTVKTYTAQIKFNGNENYLSSSTEAIVTVNIETTKITATDITTTFNVNKELVITLKNSQNTPIANAQITVDLGTGPVSYPTDSNGQVKIATKSLTPKTYTAQIKFDGNENFINSSTVAKVIVKKATPKLTAKATSFKKSVKTKKYTVTFKTNTGGAMKNVKLTIKVNGKSYSATTGSNGKATFKINKLTKKGTFKATITYKGNSKYNKLTKSNIKITVK